MAKNKEKVTEIADVITEPEVKEETTLTQPEEQTAEQPTQPEEQEAPEKVAFRFNRYVNYGGKIVKAGEVIDVTIEEADEYVLAGFGIEANAEE